MKETMSRQRPSHVVARSAPGMVAVLALLTIGLVMILATGLLAVGFREWRIGVNEQAYDQALFHADAGLEEAKMRLSPTAPPGARITPVANTAWRAYILSGYTQAQTQAMDPTYGLSAASGYTQPEPTTYYTYYPTVQAGSAAIPWGWARIQYKVNSTGQIVYLNAADGTETTAASEVVGGQTVNNFPVLVVGARGITDGAQREVHLELQPIIQTTSTQTQTTTTVVTDPFGTAVHGKISVTLVGNAATDSYNSSVGAYNVNGNRSANGGVSTDSTAAAAVSVGNGTVQGNAAVGPAGNPSTGITVGPNGSISGTRNAEAAAWNIPVTTIPAGIPCTGNLQVTGNGKNATKLSGGTYCFTSISITGNGQLQATGPVVIYVTGSVNIAGNGIVTANNGLGVPAPPNMLIYSTGTTVSVGGNGNFYGAIYAPAASISVDGNAGANVFGALTGNTVAVNSSRVHYDQALQNLGATTQVLVTTTNTTTYTTTGFRRNLWNEAFL